MIIELTDIGKDQLITYLKIANKQTEKVALNISPNNDMTFQYISTDRTNMMKLLFSNNTHVKMSEVEPQIYDKPFELGAKDMLKILSFVKKQKIVINTVKDCNNAVRSFNFVISDEKRNDIQKEIQIPLYTHVQEEMKDITLEYDQDTGVSVNIPIEVLLDTLNELKEYGFEAIELVTNEEANTLEMICKNLNLNKSTKIILHEGIELFTNYTNNVNATYTINFLMALIIANPSYPLIRLNYKAGAPLVVLYLNQDGDTNMHGLIAPRLEDEDEDETEGEGEDKT